MQEQDAAPRCSEHSALRPQGEGLHGCTISIGRLVAKKYLLVSSL